jgi:hypothetical protein
VGEGEGAYAAGLVPFLAAAFGCSDAIGRRPSVPRPSSSFLARMSHPHRVGRDPQPAAPLVSSTREAGHNNLFMATARLSRYCERPKGAKQSSQLGLIWLATTASRSRDDVEGLVGSRAPSTKPARRWRQPARRRVLPEWP